MKRSRKLGVFATWLGLMGIFAPEVLHAQPSSQANPAAVALFEEAKVLTANGRFRAACPKLEASLGIEWGMGTLYRLADCYENIGRAASAWAGFRDVLILATILDQAERAQAARERLAAVEPKRSKLRILVAPEAAASGVEVRRDNVVVSPLAWGAEVPVDPGSYIVTASAPGRTEWLVSVEVKEAGKVFAARVPVLEPSKGPSAPGSAAAALHAPLTAEGAKAAWFYDEGLTAVAADQWGKAREAFLSAWRIRQDWRIAIELGRTELMLGKLLDAVDHLNEYVRQAPESVPAVERQSARSLLDAARSRLGVLTVKVGAQGAEVLVDGKAVGRTPLGHPILVEPGRRTVEARLEGRAPERVVVDVTPGLARDVTLTFSALRADDGRGLEASNLTGYEPDSWRRWGTIVGIGLTAAGLGVGIGFTVAALGKRDEAAEELDRLRKTTPVGEFVCPVQGLPRCSAYEDALDANQVLGTASIIGYVIGGIAGAGTLALALWPTERGESTVSSRIQPVPVVSATYAGLLVAGSF